MNDPSLFEPQTYVDLWTETWSGYAKAMSPEARAAMTRMVDVAMHNAKLERFTLAEVKALIERERAAEREACAQIAEEAYAMVVRPEHMTGWKDACDHVEATIRARGSK